MKFFPPAQSAQYRPELPVLPIKNSRATAYQGRLPVIAGRASQCSHNLVMLPYYPIDGSVRIAEIISIGETGEE